MLVVRGTNTTLPERRREKAYFGATNFSIPRVFDRQLSGQLTNWDQENHEFLSPTGDFPNAPNQNKLFTTNY